MPARNSFSSLPNHVLSVGIALASFAMPLWCQKPSPRPISPNSGSQGLENQGSDVNVGVRDSRGVPIGVGAMVHLYATGGTYNFTTSTREVATAHFSNVLPGEYELEVTCPGYRKATEHLSVMANLASMPVYVYLVPESENTQASEPPRGVVMTPQLRSEIEKSLLALQKQQFETARKTLAKAVQKSPGNADVWYFMGVAELGLQQKEMARDDFQHALSLDPNHELALVSLGQLQLQSGATAEAISSFEKAVSTGRGGWRAHYELASAYFKDHRLKDADTEASRAIRLSKEKGGAPTFLLGEVQLAEGKNAEAKRTWETLVSMYPSDAVVPEAKQMLNHLESEGLPLEGATAMTLPAPPIPEVSLVNVVERTWAPPDIDSVAYDVAADANCKTEEVLDGALQRIKSELTDFEKFTATEHIEHQQIDRYGWPGPMKSRDFSYIVLIYPFGKNSFYLQESRGDGGNDLTSFPTSIATTGLNSLGVSVVQPYYRERFNYSCEGFTKIRGQGTWQIRFEEKRDATGASVRQWRKDGKLYEIPVKGRIWISTSSHAILRIETELREPIASLELTKDHLLVDYGPVKFASATEQLWLPWSAEMYMELHGKRYHHRHYLSDYMLFGVDTTHKISKPKEVPPREEASP